MSDPVSIGAIRLHDQVVPTLAAGVYRVRSGLDVQDVTHGGPLPGPPEGIGVIDVDAPRFSIDSSEIVSRHPPRSAAGDFGDRLPHVALGRRTLPWERRLPDGTPWIAVILVRVDEADLVTSPLRAALAPEVVAAMEAADPITGDPSVTLLKIKDLAVFRAILPSRADVRLLAHDRQVNVSDTALAAGDDDGWFAVVTANRLPLPGAEPVPYLACLVSLDGRDDVWTAPGPQPPPLIVLNSWTFTSGGAGGTFEHLAATLDLAPFGAPAAETPAVIGPEGGVSLARTLRDGTPASATYRGPLLGLAPDGAPSASTDVSYCAATQLGLLLAGGDGRFLREVVSWQRTAESAARASIARSQLADALSQLQAPAARSAIRRSPAPGPDLTSGADAASGTDTTAGSALSEAVLDILRAAHDRPANLWQPHPAGLLLAARSAPTAPPPEPAPRPRRRSRGKR